MKNTIQISTAFSFKGETFKPTAVVDLDQLIRKDGSMPDLHHMLAVQDGIDTYSYAFEVMQQSELSFEHATGLASECLNDDHFDLPMYIQKRDDNKSDELLQKIAKDVLDIDDLNDKPEIRDALTQAYLLGQSN